MRTESEMLSLILEAAEKDENIRAVIRTDLAPVREYLYMYNFTFIVNDIGKYDDDGVFESCFGDRILLFRGDRNYPEMFPNAKAHMMVFRDGITSAINVTDKAMFMNRYNGGQEHENVWIGDTFRKILDKDGLLPQIERLEEKQTLFAETPTEERFLGVCNEFWWVMKTFTEYTLREELLSAMFYLNVAVRDILNQMLRWHIFLREGKPVDMGILDSNMKKLLEEDMYLMYKDTYPAADIESVWKAFDAVVSLWGRAAVSVAQRCGISCPKDTEKDMLAFIHELRMQKETGAKG